MELTLFTLFNKNNSEIYDLIPFRYDDKFYDELLSLEGILNKMNKSTLILFVECLSNLYHQASILDIANTYKNDYFKEIPKYKKKKEIDNFISNIIFLKETVTKMPDYVWYKLLNLQLNSKEYDCYNIKNSNYDPKIEKIFNVIDVFDFWSDIESLEFETPIMAKLNALLQALEMVKIQITEEKTSNVSREYILIYQLYHFVVQHFPNKKDLKKHTRALAMAIYCWTHGYYPAQADWMDHIFRNLETSKKRHPKFN